MVKPALRGYNPIIKPFKFHRYVYVSCIGYSCIGYTFISMSLAYHIIIGFFILAALPAIVLRMVFDSGFRSDLLTRFKGCKALESLHGCLWIHAASIGEVQIAKTLISALKEKGETRPVAISTFTLTGFEQAKKEGLENVFRMPPDFPLWLNPIFDHLCPSLLIIVEAEMWPSLLCECKLRGIPVLLANGRITQKSTDRYKTFFFFFNWIAENISFFSMRTQKDANRLLSLGVDPDKISIDGNIKFDKLITSADISSGMKKESNWVVFGSTRPGDEGPAMEAIIRLHEEYVKLKFVIAPRHIERLQEVKELIRNYGMEFQLHSELRDSSNSRLILLDRLGELNEYYTKACLAFVGGGFNPRFGGQNIIEPASHGLPVVFGRYMNNFEEEARLLIESGGGVQVNNPRELYDVLNQLLANREECRHRGERAYETVVNNHGAVEKTIELINRLVS